MLKIVAIAFLLTVCAAFHMPEIPQDILQTKSFEAPKAATPCISQTLLHCQHSFNTYLGIPGEADWHNPQLLDKELFHISTSSTAGLLKVCNAREKFFDCLGTSYDSCINPFYFLKRGFSISDSYLFVHIMHQWRFACGGGLEIGLANWHCITERMHSSGTQIHQCFNQFNTTLHQHPNQFCNAAQTFQQCYRQPFKMCNAQSSWWACELIHVGWFSNHCRNLRCDVQ